MVSFNPHESFVFETTIRAMDLIKVANQLFQDKMQYVKLSIDYCNDEDLDGSIRIYAIPTAISEDVKKYPRIPSVSTVEIDTDFLD